MNRRIGAVVAAGALLIGGLASTPAGAAELPSGFQAKLKAAKRITFGQTVNLLGGCSSGSEFACKKYGALRVSLGPVSLRTPIDPSDAVLVADIKVQNLAKTASGTLPEIRCSNVNEAGGYYVGSVNTQFLDGRTQEQGAYFFGFPNDPKTGGAMKPTACQNAVIWIAPNPDFGKAAAKKAKLAPAAYIPLPPELLAQLEAQQAAGAATAG